ncbi:MAG: M24 family metallopeptidase [Acutalibacteraceae bacterium]
MNISKLQNIIKAKNEALIISSEVNRRYFTEFPSTDGFLVVTGSDAVFFTDSRYIEAAEKSVAGCSAKLLTRVSAEIVNYLKDNNIEKVLCEKERLTVSQFESLKKALSPIKLVASNKLENKINALRITKSKDEVKKIIKAQRIAEDAFRHILTFIKPGVTERQIGLELDFYMLTHGAEALSFETIAVTGAKTSMPHGVPDDTVVKDGDFVTMDFGAVFEGYHSDMTRTVGVGNISGKQKLVYNIVLQAQLEALNSLKAGVTCKEADAKARDIIKDAGYGQFFGHGTGHGVGIEIHENPSLSPRSEAVLKYGHIVTVEPGIYIPGEFGVRIEDMAYIKRNDCQNLTDSPKELIIL